MYKIFPFLSFSKINLFIDLQDLQRIVKMQVTICKRDLTLANAQQKNQQKSHDIN